MCCIGWRAMAVYNTWRTVFLFNWVLLSSSQWVFCCTPGNPSPHPQLEKRQGFTQNEHWEGDIPMRSLIAATIRCGQAGHSDYMLWTVSGHISFHSLSSFIMQPMHARAKCESHPCIPAILSRGARIGAAVNIKYSAHCSHRVESRACRHRTEMAQSSQFSRVPPIDSDLGETSSWDLKEKCQALWGWYGDTLVSRSCRKEQDRT